MASVNKVILVGNCGSDPQVKTFASGNKVASITLATSERYTDRDGNQKEETEWHSVQAFGKLADIVEKYVRKGSLLYVDGKIRTRSWEGQDGKTNYRTEVVMQEMQMLNRVGEQNRTYSAPIEDDKEKDLPF